MEHKCVDLRTVIKGGVVPVGLWFSAVAGFVRRFSVVITEEGLLLTSSLY